jgi:hypothetical protein
MHIAQVDALEASALGNFLAAKGMATGGRGEVMEIEVRVKAQETVRDIRV